MSDRVSCITLKGRLCDTIVLNVHVPSEDKDDDIIYEEIERLFDQLPMYHMKIPLGNFECKSRTREYFSANNRDR